MSEKVMVRQSGINGVGVFAVESIPQGECVLAIDDSHIVDEERPLPEKEKDHCDFLQGGKVVWMQPPEVYINHSCAPNVYVRTIAGIRQVIALREIGKGEEVAYDYCINGVGDVVWHCNCGSDRCRRVIHSDFFQLPPGLQKEYLPLLDQWFLEERSIDVAKLYGEILERPADRT